MTGHREIDGGRPVFVVGMNGSGTTMLLDHLNSHSLVYGFREETRVLPFYLAKFDESGGQTDPQALWKEMCSAYTFWKANKENDIPWPEDWASRTTNPATVFDHIMRYFAARDGKTIWAEKTPMHALHISLIARYLPSARFIHIIRDGRDCAASFKRRWGHNPKVTMQRWRDTIATARRQAQSLPAGRYMEVRFENLTQYPESVFQEICAFLEIDFEEQMMTNIRSTKRVRGIDQQQILPNSGSFRRFFNEAEVAALENIGGRMLASLGYEVANPEGDANLSRTYMLLSRAGTYIGRIGDVAHRARKSGSPWRLIRGRFRSGLQYLRSMGHKH